MTQPSIFESADRVGERVEAYYEEVLRGELEKEENVGKLLFIDTLTNEYVIGASSLEMGRLLASPNPEAVYLIRISYTAVTGLGTTVKSYRDTSSEEMAWSRYARSVFTDSCGNNRR